MLGNIYMTPDDIIRSYNLELIEINGDIKFYRDPNTKKQYQLINKEFVKVKDGNIAYKFIQQVNGYKIKYNINGLYGFTIFKGSTPLEDRIWSLKQAIKIACEM